MIRRRRTDESVGALLRSLEVPEHADDFFERLGASLLADDEIPGDRKSDVVDLSVRRDAPARSKRGVRRVMRGATAPAAAVACFALVVGGGLLGRQTVEDRRDRAEVRQRLLSIQPPTAAKTGLRVQFRHSKDGKTVQSYEAVISPNGDYHVSRRSPKLEANYDATTGVRSLFHAPEGVPVLQTGTVPPAGRPDRPTPDSIGLLSRDLGAGVRAIAAEDPAAVSNVTLLGRSAIDYVSTDGGGAYFATQHLVIDSATGISLVVEQRKADGTFARFTYVDALMETALDAAALAPPLPTAQAVAEPNAERTTDLPALAGALAYSPVTPRWAPAGYRLSHVTFAPTLVDVDEQTNPSSADVVSLVYRNGFDSFTVTNRRAVAGSGSARWSDPFLQGNPLVSSSSVGRVAKGALAGVDLQVSVSAVLWPHVWAQRGDVVVTIAGNLTRAELLRVAESLAPYRH
ncbi:MAG: hypothetical protein ABIM89_11645 [Mycobacteriales bacterium]